MLTPTIMADPAAAPTTGRTDKTVCLSACAIPYHSTYKRWMSREPLGNHHWSLLNFKVPLHKRNCNLKAFIESAAFSPLSPRLKHRITTLGFPRALLHIALWSIPASWHHLPGTRFQTPCCRSWHITSELLQPNAARVYNRLNLTCLSRGSHGCCATFWTANQPVERWQLHKTELFHGQAHIHHALHHVPLQTVFLLSPTRISLLPSSLLSDAFLPLSVMVTSRCTIQVANTFSSTQSSVSKKDRKLKSQATNTLEATSLPACGLCQ